MKKSLKEIKDSDITEAQRSYIRGDRTPRQIVGRALENASDFINDNLVVARSGVMTAVFLLGAYGLSHSPLFFRYRNASEIPGGFFLMVSCDLTVGLSNRPVIGGSILFQAPEEAILPRRGRQSKQCQEWRQRAAKDDLGMFIK